MPFFVALPLRSDQREKFTRDANKAINHLLAQKNSLLAQITSLELEDKEVYTSTLLKHEAKTTNFGLVLGVIAVLSDGILFALLWTVKRLKREVLLLAREKRNDDRKQPNGDHKEAKIKEVETVGGSKPGPTGERRTIGYLSYNDDRTDGDRNTVIIEKDKIRQCKHCGTEFEYKHWNAQYCSDKCRVSAWEARTGKRLKKTKKQVTK